MTSGRRGSRTYELTCMVCAFTSVVEGDIDSVFDAIESHQDERANSRVGHFVEVETVPSTRSPED